MIYNENIARIRFRIRNRRIEKGYSHKFMAYELGVSQNCYIKLELGVISLHLHQLLLISDILELNLRELVKADNSPITEAYRNNEVNMHIAGIPFKMLKKSGHTSKLGAGFIAKAV